MTSRPNSKGAVAPVPEENLELLKDPVSPKKRWNWSGKHFLPANTIRHPMKSPQYVLPDMKEMCLYNDSLQRGVVGSDLFCVTVVLFAQGFEKLQIHLWLRRPWLDFALVATRRSCGSALNFADSWFWERERKKTNIQRVRKTLRQKQDIRSWHGTSEAEILFCTAGKCDISVLCIRFDTKTCQLRIRLWSTVVSTPWICFVFSIFVYLSIFFKWTLQCQTWPAWWDVRGVRPCTVS